MQYRTFTTVLMVIVAATVCGQQRQDNRANPYPNELPQYHFYLTAPWHVLVPAKSTMADVRKALGDPDEARDITAFTEQYPGDAAAKKPVFAYKRMMQGWEVLVYFSRYCFHVHPHDPTGDGVCSVDLIPKRRISFAAVQFPAVFTKTHIPGVEVAWDEYADGTGLRYEVYETGNLNRISYGQPLSLKLQERDAQERIPPPIR